MLICYGYSVRLPQDGFAYLAFRLALQETLFDIELHLARAQRRAEALNRLWGR